MAARAAADLVERQPARARSGDLALQDVEEAILADMAAAEQHRSGKKVSPFRPSLGARCKAVVMLVLLYGVVMPLSCAAVLAAVAVRLAWRVLARASAPEDPYAQPPHRGTALVSGAWHKLRCSYAYMQY